MPPKKSSKRSRVRLNPAPWVWLVFFAHLYVAIQHSPLTSARVIRVVGSLPQDSDQISKILGRVKGIPSQQVNGLEIESDIQKLDSVLVSEYSQNLFGRGLLRVTSKRPVARVVDKPDLALDQFGGVFSGGADSETLVSILLPETTVEPTGLVMCGYPRQKLAQLCEMLKNKFKDQAFTLEVSDLGVISLRVPERSTIILGSSDALERKLQKFREMLDNDPELLSRNSAINLTAPDYPVEVPSGG